MTSRYVLLRTIVATLVDVGSHDRGGILSAKVALSAKEELEVFLGGVKDYGEGESKYIATIQRKRGTFLMH